jgi:SAM-dependent methyltransferase
LESARLSQIAPRYKTMKLITAGRITGLPHIVEVRFSVRDGSFYALAGVAKSDWVKNALARGSARVHVGDVQVESDVSLATEEERVEVLEDFRQRYGKKVVQDWYSKSRVAVRFVPNGPSFTKVRESGELGSKTDFRAWKAQNLSYYSEVAAAFDSASEEYDFTISHNFLNTWIRKKSIGLLLSYVNKSDTLIEIGCGTGAEAIEISGHVKRIFATDLSEDMIRLLRRKVEARGLTEKIIPVRLVAREIERTLELMGSREARVAYSFNGALNCEPELGRFVQGLASVLSADGYLICSIRNKLCISEALFHGAALRFDKLNMRKVQPMMVSVGGREIPSTYFSTDEFVRFFRSGFNLKRMVALPGLLPPAYLNSYYVKFRGALSILERLDPLLGSRFPLNKLGDQTLFVFQKK